MRRRMVGAVLMAMVLVGLLGSTGLAREQEHDRVFYYHMVIGTDGAQNIEMMTREDALAQRKEQRKAYMEARKEWLELKKKWAAAVGDKTFPVPRPLQPKLTRLGKVPTTEQARDRLIERYRRRVEVWDVVLIRTTDGEKMVEVVRRDKQFAKKRELYLAYMEAVVAWAEQRKAEPDKKGDDAPPRPVTKVLKGSLSSSELADKLAERLNQKLAERADKEKEKDDR